MNISLIVVACFSLNLSEVKNTSSVLDVSTSDRSSNATVAAKPTPLMHDEVRTIMKERAQKHWLYKFIPRKRADIAWFDIGRWFTWTLFGNEDDGIFGEEDTARYRTRLPICTRRAIAWTARNPLHNLNFYVIGSADKENSEFTILSLSDEKMALLQYKRRATTVFAGKSTSFFLGLHGWKPFISLRLDYGFLFDFYIGWRERGNFGIKLTPFKKKHKKLRYCNPSVRKPRIV